MTPRYHTHTHTHSALLHHHIKGRGLKLGRGGVRHKKPELGRKVTVSSFHLLDDCGADVRRRLVHHRL